jgi:PKD repeat protein
VASAGPDKIARKNIQVNLDGSGSSDADGDVLAYVWTQTGGPMTSLAGPDTATPSFTPTSVGEYHFRLAVDDGDGGTDIDTVIVTIYGLPPVARIVASKSIVEAGSSISFDASTSGDSDGAIEEFQFDFGDGTRENLTTATADHTYFDSGIYTVMLTVIDGDGNSSYARLTVRITSAPRNILADMWWLLAIIVILAANVVYFALEWRRWKGKMQKTGLGGQVESESQENEKEV